MKKSLFLLVPEARKSKSLVPESGEGSHNITRQKRGRESKHTKEKAGRMVLLEKQPNVTGTH